MTKLMKSACLVGAVCAVLCIFLSGCGGGKPNNGEDAQYTLELVVEKNLDAHLDYLYIRFLRDGVRVTQGYVKVNGDSVATSASGQASKTYASSHFPHGATVQIVATDPGNNFVYADEIVMPNEFHITDFIPNERLWQGVNSTVRFSWTGAPEVNRYMVSVTPSTPGSTARGLAEVVTGDLGRSFAFTHAAFRDTLPSGEILNDNYHVRVIGYNRNFVQRPNTNYKAPSVAFDEPISEADISGAISAVVVTARDSIRVELSQ